MNRVLNYGMVGGSPDGFIGKAHRQAINIDGKVKIVAGCFSRAEDKIDYVVIVTPNHSHY